MTQEKLLNTGIIALIGAIAIEFLSRYISLLSRKLAIIVGVVGISLISFVVLQWVFESTKEFIEKNIKRPVSENKERKQRMESEINFIKSTLGNDLEEMTIEKLKGYYEKLKRRQFMPEVFTLHYHEWSDYLESVRKKIETEEAEVWEYQQKYELQKHNERLESISTQIKVLEQKDVEEKKSEKEAFLEEYGNKLYEYRQDLDEQQQQWLLEKGFEKSCQWDIHQKKTVEMLIHCRSNEGPSHAYLVGAIWEYITNEGIDHDAKMFETKMPDIVFTVSGFTWAIEVETGSVLRKNSKQLQEKVAMLNANYEKRWFFVVTNKNLVSKYRQFGETVERTEVLDKVWEIYDPHGEVAHALAQQHGLV